MNYLDEQSSRGMCHKSLRFQGQTLLFLVECASGPNGASILIGPKANRSEYMFLRSSYLDQISSIWGGSYQKVWNEIFEFKTWLTNILLNAKLYTFPPDRHLKYLLCSESFVSSCFTGSIRHYLDEADKTKTIIKSNQSFVFALASVVMFSVVFCLLLFSFDSTRVLMFTSSFSRASMSYTQSGIL